jgi:hypothetical protein
LQRKPLDPGLRRDDDFECTSFYNVIPIFESTTFEALSQFLSPQLLKRYPDL